MTKVLLFSGGMDSVIINHLYTPDIKLFFDLGGEYQDQERKVARKYNCVIDNSLQYLNDRILLNSILPMRNLYFIMEALRYGDEIILGSTLSDAGTDKDEKFRLLTQELLIYINLSKKKDLQRTYDHLFNCDDIKILAPFENYTKSEMVKLFLEKGGDKQELIDCWSCYKAEEKECGKCSPCIRKYASLKNNNIDISNIFETNPKYELKHLIDELEKYNNSKEPSKTIEEIKQCII